MTNPDNITPEYLEKLFSGYDIGIPKSIKPLITGNFHIHEWIVTTDQDIFVVKFANITSKSPQSNADRINNILTKISGLEINLPYIIPDRNNQLVTPINGYTVEVRKYISGESFNPANQLLFGSAGRLLASIQKELRNFDLEDNELHALTGKINFNQIHDDLYNIKMNSVVSEENEDISAVIRTTNDLIDIAQENGNNLTTKNYWELPTTIVGINFTQNNLACYWHSVTGIKRIDCVRRDVRIIDIAKAAIELSLNPFDSKSVNPDSMTVFLDAYQQISKLSDLELAILPEAYIGVKLFECFSVIHLGAKSGINLIAELKSYLVNKLREIEKWQNNMGELVERSLLNYDRK